MGRSPRIAIKCCIVEIVTLFCDISPSLNNICNHQITRCQGIGFEFLGDMFIINSLGDFTIAWHKRMH